jgi:hypothetical protein
VCPVCSPKIRERRALEIQTGLAFHKATGGGVEFVTFTLQHHRAERLAPLLDLVADGFRAVIGSGRFAREWYLDRTAFGIVGTIRTLEINYGENGWHPHLHVLFLTDRPMFGEERELFTERLWDRWSTFLADKGHHGTVREFGIKVLPVVMTSDVARYMSKVYDTLHLEMSKDLDGQSKGRNPFRLLGDLVEAGRADPLTGELNPDWVRWREYVRAIKGRKFLTWSHGLKDRLEVNDISDQEAAEAEEGGVVVAVIEQWTWRVVRHCPEFYAQILTAAELHGEAGVYELLDCVPVAA